MVFNEFIECISVQKIPRLNRKMVITEKIDGTNASIFIPDPTTFPGEESVSTVPFLVGSRNRWITPSDDNFGFAKWAYANAEEILKLGPGQHFGEWWGSGIHIGYGFKGQRFTLFHCHTPDSPAS